MIGFLNFKLLLPLLLMLTMNASTTYAAKPEQHKPEQSKPEQSSPEQSSPEQSSPEQPRSEHSCPPRGESREPRRDGERVGDSVCVDGEWVPAP